jgi:predicted nuclease of predicted toxin-antitoxin system
MPFLADENIPPALTEYLRSHGLDVRSVEEEGLRGAEDRIVYRLARDSKRTLLTFDRHFANIHEYPPSDHYGIILIRIHPAILTDVVSAFEVLLTNRSESQLIGSLVILEKEGFRIRR